MQGKNRCWDCKNNKIKLNILVPYNSTIREYIRLTGNMQSNFVGVVREKGQQYAVWYHSGDELRIVKAKVLHSCMLRVERNKKDNSCKNFEAKDRGCEISGIIYSKLPMPPGVSIKVPKLNALSSFTKAKKIHLPPCPIPLEN